MDDEKKLPKKFVSILNSNSDIFISINDIPSHFSPIFVHYSIAITEL